MHSACGAGAGAGYSPSHRSYWDVLPGALCRWAMSTRPFAAYSKQIISTSMVVGVVCDRPGVRR